MHETAAKRASCIHWLLLIPLALVLMHTAQAQGAVHPMKVGFRAAAWALLWKFKALPRTNPTPLEFPVAEFIGVRFNQNPEV